MQKKLYFAFLFIIFCGAIWLGHSKYQSSSTALPAPKWWKVQSVDTMKYSRDLTAEKLEDASFDVIIDEQVHTSQKLVPHI